MERHRDDDHGDLACSCAALRRRRLARAAAIVLAFIAGAAAAVPARSAAVSFGIMRGCVDEDKRVDCYRVSMGRKTLVEAKDSTGDSFLDTWEYYSDGDLRYRVVDQDGNGRPERWEIWEGHHGTLWRDVDGDGEADVSRQIIRVERPKPPWS